MKKLGKEGMFRKRCFYVITMLCLTFIMSCGVTMISSSSIVQAATKAKINTKALSLEEGKKYTLKVSGTNVTKWSSTDKTVAKVSKGKVTAVKAGTATIKAKCENGKTYKCTVTVTKKAGSVKINKTNFPDEIFRKFVSENFDLNHDGILSVEELSKVTEINIWGSWGIYSSTADLQEIKGIEYFGNLTILYLWGTQVTNIDLRDFPKLEVADCTGNGKLLNLNIENCPKLQEVVVDYAHSLEKWNISNGQNLKKLGLSECNISEIDLGQFLNLENLNCSDNNLTTLDISMLKNLTELNCARNSLSDLNVSNNVNLKKLNCGDNEIESLDVTKLLNLTELNCRYNYHLTELDVTKCTKLSSLNCSGNAFTSLDVSNCTELEKLICNRAEGAKLTSLNLCNCKKLKELDLLSCCLGKLDVTKCVELEYLNCYGNDLKKLNVSKCTKLKSLNCSYNYLENIDISKCPNLDKFECDLGVDVKY